MIKGGEFLIKDLEKFKLSGLIKLAISSCINIIKIDIRTIRFTIWILFKPDVQSIINSLSFSNFRIVIIDVIKKENGINFVSIFGNDRSE